MSGHRPPTVREIAGALALRAWAIDALQPATGRHAGIAPRVSLDAWRLFLAAERCAAPLLAALGSELPQGSSGDLLRAAATAEAQRALAARRAAAEIGAALRETALRETGLRVALLKGGAEVVESGRTFFLTDLDLLAEPAALGAVTAVLASLGYVADREQDAAEGRSYDVTFTPPIGGVQIELHWTTRHDRRPMPAATWESFVPLRRAPGLFALAPASHAWHILTHGVLDHPDQQGRIRDALVLSTALDRGDDAVREGLRARAARHSCAAALQRALALAESLGGRAHATGDTFRREAAIGYALRGSMSNDVPRPFLPTAVAAVLLGAGAGAPGRASLRSSLRLHDVEETTAARALHTMPRPVQRAAGRAARIALYALHALPATPLLARATAARVWRAVLGSRSTPRRAARAGSHTSADHDA